MRTTERAVSRLYPGKEARSIFPGTTNDRFVLVIGESDAALDVSRVEKFLQTLNVVAVPVNDPWLAAPDTPADRIETQRHEHYCKRFAQGCFD